MPVWQLQAGCIISSLRPTNVTGSLSAHRAGPLANTDTNPTNKASYTLVGNGLGGSVAALIPEDGASLSLSPLAGGAASPTVNASFEARLRAREREQLTTRIPAARRWMAARRSASSPG